MLFYSNYHLKRLILLGILNNKKQVLLVKQTNGYYGFPKGHVENNETEIETAKRETKEETNLDIKLDGLVGVYSNPERDPRRHTVSVVYKATIVGDVIQSGSDAKDAKFFNIEDALKMNLAFDHNEILNDAFK